mmetsp:Transcript_9976/g.28048  ORF Transcript_9976/g.28048 Transcript_9976/m.28048 type:complete len:487 (+) Transcript_9976:59-1519(+)|eukprot:CAMPEP_0119139136 /NCGR_PEP_ID=MMETSP1310-20130426/26958_1 /TAXON_ID=464262 /ORGANISM="Genus nov. species nov., Strain RCC2339" /LENGTH=486 /DNA_ID=CAMNT_0007130397 /DNA_START=48 /DNA_END=1508 /DNA_ORIENTATION=+
MADGNVSKRKSLRLSLSGSSRGDKRGSSKTPKSSRRAGRGCEPFPGVQLKYVIDPDKTDAEDIAFLSARTSRSGKREGQSTPQTARPSRKGGPPSKSGGEAISKTKRMAPEEARERYKDLPEEGRLANGNPKSLAYLHPDTIAALRKAGVEPNDQDEAKWVVLLNCLRFLHVDDGLRFARKPTPPREFSDLDQAEMLHGPLPAKVKLQKEIGSGSYGRVYQAKWSELDKGLFAVKKMAHKERKEVRANLNEVFYLSKYSHPHIVTFHRAFVSNDEIWLLTEFMHGGTLSQTGYPFQESEVAFLSHGLLQALEFLHAQDVVHRDLKSENIMMTVHGDVKLIDFGLAASTAEGPLVQMCGSPYWLSPEMIRMDPHDIPTDIWSFAISLMEMINGHPPNYSNALHLMYTTGTLSYELSHHLPASQCEKWSDSLKDFASRCLVPDPEKRDSAGELLQHDFLSIACDKKQMRTVLERIFVTAALMDTGLAF